jgi:hypothetical protein
MNRKYNFNESFFENIDCESKAYALGLIYSDGNIHVNGNSYYIIFGQSEERKDIVYKLNDILDSEANVHEIIKGSKLFYYIKICSKKMYDDLEKWGISPNKSLTILFPQNIGNTLMPHFIRGLFDGDGCIWNGKRKKILIHEWGNSRMKIVHNVKFNYTGNDKFVESFQNYLINEIGLSKTKLNYSKAKNKNNNTSEHICTMEYSGRGNIKKLYDYMYKDATIFSNDKKVKFEKILCALDEKSSSETELIAGNPLEP